MNTPHEQPREQPHEPHVQPDQADAAYAFQDSYAQRFPAAASLAEKALTQLNQIAAGSDRQAILHLRMPVSPEGQKTSEATREEEGCAVVGAVPDETRALLDGLYGLIGAKVERDDHAAGEASGTVVRSGAYHKRPVYITEYYGQTQPGGRPTLTVWLMDQARGKLSLSDLSDRERDEFMALSGIPGGNAVHVVANHGANRSNYRAVAGAIAEAQRVVDTAVSPKPRRSVAHRIARLFSQGGGWRA